MNVPIIPPTQAALVETDRCVKCGLCLPHCPTYRLYMDENESPRGRIALAEALLKGLIPADESTRLHIDRCLLCQSCEKVCPSQVNYSQIMHTVRKQWSRTGWIDQLVKRPKLFSSMQHLARMVPNLSCLPAPIRLAQALKSQRSAPKPGIYPPTGSVRGRVGLFLGCVTRVAQADALHASIRVLNALGYAVFVPKQLACCGALAAHQGDKKSADEMAHINRQAFADEQDIVLLIASGCAAYLQKHPFSAWPTSDILTFLLQTEMASVLHFRPLDKTVAVHQPCSLVNGLNQAGSQTGLLKQIPEIELIELATPGDCCGAGGNHMLTRRKQAEALRQPLIERSGKIKPDYLVTSNIGCALHLAEGIQQSGLPIQVMHPIELLAQQLSV